MNREFFKGLLEALHLETRRRLRRAVVRLIGLLLTTIGLIVVFTCYDERSLGWWRCSYLGMR